MTNPSPKASQLQAKGKQLVMKDSEKLDNLQARLELETGDHKYTDWLGRYRTWLDGQNKGWDAELENGYPDERCYEEEWIQGFLSSLNT